jgi:murein DD-endopeptidase MepM/ murein hydrolase activator NlpD
MHPRKLDAEGIASGRRVKEGETLGTIGNYNRRPGMTTTHLHFEMQVPTRDGWVRVNPYMTLVASYEHLIGARGSEVAVPPPPVAEIAATESGAVVANEAPVKTAAVVAAASVKVAASVDKKKPRITKHGKAKSKGKAFKGKAKTRVAAAQGRKRR